MPNPSQHQPNSKNTSSLQNAQAALQNYCTNVTSTVEVTPLCTLSCFMTILTSGQYQSVTADVMPGTGSTNPLNDAWVGSLTRVYCTGQQDCSPAAVLMRWRSPTVRSPVRMTTGFASTAFLSTCN